MKLGDEKGRPKVKPHCAHDSFGAWKYIHSTLGASAWELLISLFVCSKQNFYNFPGIKGFITRYGACLLFSQSVSQSVCNQFRPGPPNELTKIKQPPAAIFIFFSSSVAVDSLCAAPEKRKYAHLCREMHPSLFK